ncbi:peptidoglycan-binding protein [Amylibacter sp.]|nr:peptidoglycan-binding protein [Amylibacter sp.]
MFRYGLKFLAFVTLTISFFSNPINANNVLEAQKMLTKLGHAPGPIDGSFGDKTKSALENYYAAKNKKFDGKLDKNEIVDLTASIKLIKTSRQKLKKSRHIQHARYSKHIATPFRDLKVSEDFTLIDNFDSFMAFHESYLKGKLPDKRGFFNFRSKGQNINFEFCVEDIIRTNRNKAKPTFGMQSATAYCGQMISQRFLNDTQNGIKNYRKIILGWLESGIIHNPNKFGKKLSKDMMESWPYAISSNVPNILTHYALYHKLYGFSASIHQDIIQMGEAFYAQWDYYPLLIRGMPFKQKLCNLKSQYKVVVGTNDHCGSYTARMATGGIYFGLEFNSQLAFDTGIRHLEIMLATFNKDAVYAAQAQRGICALGYMKQFPPHFELIHYAFQKAYGIDFINTKNINGITPAEAYLKLWKIAHDPLETVVKYWNKHDQMSCTLNGKNQAAMVAQLKKHPSSYRDFWSGFSYEDFLLSSPILASQELPEEWKSLDNTKIRKGEGVLQTIAGGDWMGINPYLLQLALGNFEDIRQAYDAERKRIKEEELNKAKAERLRKREMLFVYNGTYKIHLGLARTVIAGKMHQDLGAILFTLNRGQPKLDENNILYQALGLNEINFSLDHDGYMIVSGKLLGEINSERRCAYLAGNLKSDKKFNPKSSPNCGASGQSLSMRFEKISDDVIMDLVDEEELKKLDGEYDVQWFITGINSTERTLRAKDKLTLSNGVGIFLGNDSNKQPSSELRKELSIQYNANGEIVILGRIDLFEKVDVKKWYASGEIHPMKKSKLKTIWGFGDIIELEIEKSKISEMPKVKEMKAEKLIYGDDFIFDKKNNSFQLKRLDEIIKINQNDFSLNFDSNDEKFFDGDISYTTSANNFGTTWIGLKVKKIEEVSHNIKIAFQIEEGSFPNFPEAFSISKNECGVFKDIVDDSFIIPLKTDDLFELELFDCHVKVLQENLNDDDFGILKNRINTAISLVDTIEITNKYF